MTLKDLQDFNNTVKQKIYSSICFLYATKAEFKESKYSKNSNIVKYNKNK